MTEACPFCVVVASRIMEEDWAGIALLDAYPVSNGHTLVIPKKHVASLYELSDDEQAALWRLVAEVRLRLTKDLKPDGFNISVNDGEAAGQTVMHAHIHIIPRYLGDVADPRGGVRWVIPEKAPYWE